VSDPAAPVVSVSEALRPLVRLGLIAARPVSSGPASAPLVAAIGETVSSLEARYAGRSAGDIPGTAPARALYRALGIDPTHTRPSSEALLRRVLSGKPFPRVNGPVDLCNLCALRWLLPIGLYDADLLSGDLSLRAGEPGEGYEGIRKDRVNLDGRPVLCDANGPFGNPTSDSRRTCVTEATRSILMVVFAPATLPGAELDARVREGEGWIREWIGRGA
jgi:DNA/RNA-binding domain of Phe-tRNA-synthetase-like protein